MNEHAWREDLGISQAWIVNELPRKLNRIIFLEEAVKFFQVNADKQFTAAFGIEELSLEEFRVKETQSATIFVALETVLCHLGFNPDGTMGGLTRMAGFDQQDAHCIGCACHGEVATGATVACRILRRINSLS